jgi:hypothetical protein
MVGGAPLYGEPRSRNTGSLVAALVHAVAIGLLIRWVIFGRGGDAAQLTRLVLDAGLACGLGTRSGLRRSRACCWARGRRGFHGWRRTRTHRGTGLGACISSGRRRRARGHRCFRRRCRARAYRGSGPCSGAASRCWCRARAIFGPVGAGRQLGLGVVLWATLRRRAWVTHL